MVSPAFGRMVARAAVIGLLALTGCKADVYTKLSERDANDMIVVLHRKGIDASRVVAKDGTNTLQVPSESVAAAVEALRAEGFPRQSFTNLGQVFKGGGLVASPLEEQARYIFALSEELSKTLSEIDGVRSARVHVVLPKNDLLKQGVTPSSASVFVRYDARSRVSLLTPQIKQLVAGSIEGLSYDKVSVVFVPVERRVDSPSTPGVAAPPANTLAQRGISLVLGLALAGIAVALVWRRRASLKPPLASSDGGA
jgi:type III secretion protein J